VRILVTNDDGVSAPGLAALTRALVAWADGELAPDEVVDAGGNGGHPVRH